MNARFVSRGRSDEDKLEYTTPIYSDSIAICLRIPHKLRGWSLFCKIFGWTVWLALVGTLILMNRAMLWMAKNKHWTYSFYTTCRSLCTLPISKLPKSTGERVVLVSGFYIGLVVTTVFQGTLFHLIKESESFERVRTLSDAYLNHKIIATSFMVRDFIHSEEKGEIKIKANVEVGPTDPHLIDEYGLAIRDKEIRLLMQTGTFRNDLYFVDERVSSFVMSYVVKRGSPFLEPLSFFTSQVFESGLSEAWYEMTINRLSKGKIIRKREPADVKVLTIWDLEVAFTALIIGNYFYTSVKKLKTVPNSNIQ